MRSLFNLNSSLAIEPLQKQWVVGRVLTRQVGLNPDLRPNGLFGFNSNYSFGSNPLQLPLVRGRVETAPPLTRGGWRGFGSVSGFSKQSGFTLVEMIMVIVITGIIGGIVAVFLKAPIQQYMDVARRAELTDIADTAVRRMARDVRTAVPNSVRIANCGTTPCVEFLPTKDGGRYRAAQDCTGACTGNVLTFGTGGSNIFDIIGTAINFAAGTTPDYIVVGSTQSDGLPPYDISANGVLRQYTGTADYQTTVNFTNTALPIWAALPSQRFDVVDGAQQAVTYACVGGGVDPVTGNGLGQLKKYWHYGFNTPSQVYPPVGVGMQTAILADKVDCTPSKSSIEYDVANQRFGLLAVRLTLTSNNESVSLYNEIHVNNLP